MGINEYIQVGNQIKKIRQEKGLTQKAVAEAAGIPYTTYSNYENNNREPSIEQLKKIAKALDVNLSDFTTLELEHRRVEIRHLEYELMKRLTNLQLNPQEASSIIAKTAQYMPDIDYEILEILTKLNDAGIKKAKELLNILTMISDYCKSEN